MLYHIKTSIMKSAIAKRQKKSFDYEAAEAFALNEKDDDSVNNSYYFSAHDYSKKESFYCRLGLRNCHNEVWFCYEKGDEKYIGDKMIIPRGEECPLTVHKDGEFWRIKYDGSLTDVNNKCVEAHFEGTFKSEEPAVDFFTHMPPVRTAKAMAQEKWSKKFFNEVRANNQVHYEQFGVMQGVLTLGDLKTEFSMPCVRDHSFGKRDWNYMNNHLWLMAINQKEQLNFSMVSYPAMTALEVGNFKPEDKPMAFVLRADYDRNTIAEGKIAQKFVLKLLLDNGETLNVESDKISETVYVFQNGEYKLVEGVANFRIDGKNYRGIFEIGINGDVSRVFNGKSAGKIKS